MSIPSLEVAFLDVGHGDSTVIILPDRGINKRAVVIDTPDHRKTIRFLEQNDVKILELVIISHFDSDHSKGISALIKHYQKEDREIKKISYNVDRISRLGDEKTNYTNLLRQLVAFNRNDGINTLVPVIEESEKNISFTGINNFFLSILYPAQSDLTDAHIRKSCNDTSIVVMLNYFDKRILLPGDLEEKGWFNLLKRIHKYNKSINCNVLKLPHHGDYYDGKKMTD